MRKLALGLFAAMMSAAVFASTGIVSPSVKAAAEGDCTVVVVTEDDITRQAENTPPTDNWVLYFRNAGDGEMVDGNRAGDNGHYQLETPTGADKVTLSNFDYAGRQLDELDRLAYSTYRTAGQLQQVAALNVAVDINGDAPGGFTTLVFEPVYNTGQGAVVNNTWQDWDAYQGGSAIWWSSNPIPGAPNRDTFVSWDTITDANPDAVIIGIGINQGSGNPGLVTLVDDLSIGFEGNCVTYDFEQFEVALTKQACKGGGWENLTRADGTEFKNQGECVSYVASGGKSGGNNGNNGKGNKKP